MNRSLLVLGALLLPSASGCELLFSWDGYSEPTAPSACALDRTVCGGACVDLHRDGSHCGACDAACPASQICASGRCSTPVYISPSGNDDNPGTEALPWSTFAHAIPALQPGNALVLMDGGYDGGSSGYPDIDCMNGGPNGTIAAPIALMAQHERLAFLRGDGSAPPLSIRNCAHWVVDGIRAEGGGRGVETEGNVFQFIGVDGLVARRLLGAEPNGGGGTSSGVIFVWNSRDVLVEECEAYDFEGRGGIRAQTSENVTFRRNYANARGTLGTSSNEQGFAFYAPKDSLAENNVAERAAFGFVLSGNQYAEGDSGDSDNDLHFGNVAIAEAAAGDIGFFCSSGCATEDPCATGDRIVDGARWVDSVVVGGQYAFNLRGQRDAVIEQMTALGPSGWGVLLDIDSDNTGLVSDARVSNAFVSSSGGFGFGASGQADWSFDHDLARGPDETYVGYDPHDEHVTNELDLDPAMGGCTVRLPDGSPLRSAGKDGKNVGAEVVYRYQGGELTSVPLWDPSRGYRFGGCGEVVAGVNDDPFTSCIGVAVRLHVGTADPSAACAMPY